MSEKLNQFPNVGTLNPVTDLLIVERSGSDSQAVPGQAAAKAVSDVTKSTLASVTGSFTTNHIAQIADVNGTIKDGGALGTAAAATASSASGTVAAVNGAITVGHGASFFDVNGTVQDIGYTPVPPTRTVAGNALSANVTQDQITGLSTNGIIKRTGANTLASAIGDTDYQNPITLTTTGTSGAATFSGDTLNIPNYTTGSGTVTSVSVTTANGVSGSVTNPTTTPAITLALGDIAPSSIAGVTNGSNAAAGKVGEVISSTVLNASAVAVSNATAADVTSISLTAGDWDIQGNVNICQMSVSGTIGAAWMSTTSSTVPDNALLNIVSNASAIFNQLGLQAPKIRVNVNTTTTVYLSVYAQFTGTAKACGVISARRIR